jgi:ABC-type glycerol-3-phosphate transport system permease component
MRVTLRTSVAALLAIPFLVPFFFLITMSIRTEADYRADPVGLPTTFTWDHLTDAWERADLGSGLVNSLITSAVGVVVACLVSMAAAYWFSIHRTRRADRLRWAIVVGYAFPAVIWLIPLFVIAARNGLTNNLIVLGLVYGASNIPFGVYMIHSFYRQVLRSEIMDAAALDGAGTLQTFRWIALPLARPAVAALAALVFVWSFGDLLFAVTFLQDSSKWTIPIAAATLVSRQTITPQGQAAAALVALAPSLVVVLVAQRALVRGFGGGSAD